MLQLNSIKYKLYGIRQKDFFEELDSVTYGQTLNPELVNSTSLEEKSDTIFAGTKSKNAFSIFLYQPFKTFFKIKILTKGQTVEKNKSLEIICSFELSFWSILMFFVILIFGISLTMTNHSYILSILIGIIIFFVYVMFVLSRYKFSVLVFNNFLSRFHN